jgi:electron transport complex protein RnfG
MMKHIKSVVSLFAICAAVAILLALTNYFTAPIIADYENQKANEALIEVLPEAKSFETVEFKDLPETVKEVYKADNGGYVFKLVTVGYGTDFVIMCGVNPDGTVSKALCLSSNETLEKEKTYGENFKGLSANEVGSVDIITGATKTTKAYRDAVKDALNSFIKLTGGNADFRTEEEILAENLNTALPAANGEFDIAYFVLALSDFDCVYSAKNGSGYVFVKGDAFTGVDKDGKILGEAPAETKTAIENTLSTIANDSLDLSTYEDLPSAVTNAAKHSDGSYSLILKGAGYGITGDKYTASGKYILIFLNIDSNGKIVECKTLFQAESGGFGSVCGEESFYSQFNGKTESDYTQIDAISNATITTNGYLKAIQRAFEAIKILEGGAE